MAPEEEQGEWKTVVEWAIPHSDVSVPSLLEIYTICLKPKSMPVASLLPFHVFLSVFVKIQLSLVGCHVHDYPSHLPTLFAHKSSRRNIADILFFTDQSFLFLLPPPLIPGVDSSDPFYELTAFPVSFFSTFFFVLVSQSRARARARAHRALIFTFRLCATY